MHQLANKQNFGLNSYSALSVICHYTAFPLSRRDKEEVPWIISLTRTTSGAHEGENFQRNSAVYLKNTAQQQLLQMVKSNVSLSGRLDKMTLPGQQKMRLIRALAIVIGLWHQLLC